jgi:hypothetical protein
VDHKRLNRLIDHVDDGGEKGFYTEMYPPWAYCISISDELDRRGSEDAQHQAQRSRPRWQLNQKAPWTPTSAAKITTPTTAAIVSLD